MRLFQLENNKIIIEPEILLIPEFKKIYEKDKSKSKEKAFSTFEYIYFVNDWNSPYMVYTDPSERKYKVKDAYIKDSDWKEDDDVKNAINKYTELTKTPLMGLLEDANHLIEVLRSYCKQATLQNIDVTKAAATLEKLPKIVDSMQKLRNIVAKEKSEKTTIRGGRSKAYDD